MKMKMRSGHFRRIANFGVMASAMWLFVSPWLLQFGEGADTPPSGPVLAPLAMSVFAASWSAWMTGALLAIAGGIAATFGERWQAWVIVSLGAWLFVAPWLLGFSGLAAAAWDHWLSGAATALLGAVQLARRRGSAEFGQADRAYAGDAPRRRG